MRTIITSISFLLLGFSCFGQITKTEAGLLSQYYSKEMTEFMAKEFILTELLNLPDKKITDFEINSITSSKSGELSTVIYDCKSLGKRGMVFCFWNDYINDFSLRYKGYSFRAFNFEEAKALLDSIEFVLEEKKNIINYHNDNLQKNAVYRWDDIIFNFYKNEASANLIRVFWKGFDSEWNQLNLNTTKKRFERFFLNSK